VTPAELLTMVIERLPSFARHATGRRLWDAPDPDLTDDVRAQLMFRDMWAWIQGPMPSDDATAVRDLLERVADQGPDVRRLVGYSLPTDTAEADALVQFGGPGFAELVDQERLPPAPSSDEVPQRTCRTLRSILLGYPDFIAQSFFYDDQDDDAYSLVLEIESWIVDAPVRVAADLLERLAEVAERDVLLDRLLDTTIFWGGVPASIEQCAGPRTVRLIRRREERSRHTG
jgi:hypothetical protein